MFTKLPARELDSSAQAFNQSQDSRANLFQGDDKGRAFVGPRAVIARGSRWGHGYIALHAFASPFAVGGFLGYAFRTAAHGDHAGRSIDQAHAREIGTLVQCDLTAILQAHPASRIDNDFRDGLCTLKLQFSISINTAGIRLPGTKSGDLDSYRRRTAGMMAMEYDDPIKFLLRRKAYGAAPQNT